MSAAGSRLIQILAPRIGYAYLWVLRWSMRLEFRNREVLAWARREHSQYILVFWHSRFVMMPFAYPDRRLVVLHSRHRDARLVAAMMRWFGLAQAWGSTSSGGVSGMREILRRVKQGYDVGMTPDGPRGPRRRVQPGVIALARLSGKPILPVAYSARPSRRLRSWDRTLLPYPFGRGVFVYGEPLVVRRQADDEEQARCARQLGEELDRLTDHADGIVGMPIEDDGA